MSTLNSSKSAYASFALDSSTFFETYRYNDTRLPDRSQDGPSRFTCQLYNKALSSVFKGRLGDIREKDTAAERCEVAIQDDIESTECRIVVKMICKHGVTKTYKLNYESTEIKHALFNRNGAKNKWRIGASVLRSFLEYFGTATEQLDMYAEDGRVAFTSYTEKVTHGREILKHPLETSVALDTLDFEEFSVEEKMHVAISVKDFRAIVLHAETLKTNVQAYYSLPTRPIQLTYNENGVDCEFTLMTIGDYQGSSMTPAPISVRGSPATLTASLPLRQASLQPTQGNTVRGVEEQQKEAMPPPSQPASRSFPRTPQMQSGPGSFRPESLSQRTSRPSPPPPKASLDPESLFLPAGDDDRQWDETNYEDEEDTLGWDASGNHDASALQKLQTAPEGFSRYESLPAWPEDSDRRIAPTQRLAEIDTLFSQG
ncbi:MAG: hypothetical protein L6R38_005849 [Xanthoria sp. 2 TBL-2021]|nr:MAG: hypothetical protein L6R38_005849 [Xanthoria sp. 2 TBL-2021]